MPDFESLYSESQANAFTSAKKRFYDNKVSDLVETEMGGKTIITAVVRGHKDYHTKIVFDEQGGLYDYSCDCVSFNLSDGPCKHIIAAALTYEEKNPQGSVQKKKYVSDGCVSGIISTYAKMRKSKVLREDPPVKLTPILILSSNDKLSLRFLIGKKRMYKVRDVSEFCALCGASTYKRYGSALAFEHCADNFDELGKKTVNFLIRSIKEKLALGEYVKDKITLSPSDVDDFFDLYDGLIEVEEGGASEGMRQVVRIPDSLRATINVTKCQGGYEVSSALNTFKLLAGKRYDYIMTSGRIYRVTGDYVEASYKLLSLLNSRDKVFVSDADIGRFYNNVLLEAEKYSTINSDSDLSVFTVPPLNASLYLDREGGVVKGRLECFYGETEVDLFAEPYGDRDYEAEDMLKESLAKYFPYFPHLILETDDDVYKLLSEGLRALRRVCAVYMTAEMQKSGIRRPPGVKVGVKLSGDLIDIDLAADDFTQEELLKIINASQSKKYVRLGDDFVDVDDPGLRAIAEALSLSGSLSVPAYYAPHLTQTLGDYYYVKTDGLARIERLVCPAPNGLSDVLRPYQQAGLNWLVSLKEGGYGGILADDMGLGKSLQIIALILAKKLKTIVVCPTTLILNWKSELSKFAPNLSVLCVMGSQDERAELIRNVNHFDVIITSYELIRRDIDQYDVEFDLAVIDEAQFIKNPETKNSRAVKKLKSKHRFALTGTPIENSLSELWSIFDFIMPGYLFGYQRFKEKFEIPIVNGEKDAEEELKRLVTPFILRRLKSDVLKELPPKIETDIVCPLIGEQADYYKAHLALIRNNLLSSAEPLNKITILTMLTKLRRICCDPVLEDGSYKGNSAKLEACMQLVETAINGGHKTLIFSQFTSMLDVIRAELLSRGITAYTLTGETPKADRLKFVNRFNKDETQVFLISLRAGGTGLNLTGADVVIHYDPWWNVSVMNQATDRAYRIGQSKSVQVYSLLLDGTLEQKIVELQKRKAKLSGLLEGNLDENELLQLIKQD